MSVSGPTPVHTIPVVHIPWYSTLFRGDQFADALGELAPVALRYGATEYEVCRARDDTYKFLQSATFADKLSFERYWEGPEFIEFRTRYLSWYQVPVLYYWQDRVARGGLAPAQAERATQSE